MKHILLAVTGLATLISLGSCGETFLFVSPEGSLDRESLENQQGVEMLVASAYANLHEGSWGATPFNWALSGMYGGDANKGSDPGDQSVLNEMEMYNTMATNGYLGDKWEWTYKGNKRVTIAFSVMASADDMSETLKNARKAELYFLRAMFYFESVRVFGPFIPYIDENNTEDNPLVHNDTDIYPNILGDIDKAIAGLPNTQSEPGRVNKWAAVILKAKILMQKGDLATAKPLLADALANGVTSFGKKYALADDMSQNWDAFSDNTSPESVWEIQFTSELNNANQGMSICYPHNSGPGGCCGFYQPSYELVNSYQVDNNGLPYLNGEYRTKESVSRKGNDGESFAIHNNDIAVDPRLDFAIGRYAIPYKDWGTVATDWVRNYVNGGIFLPKKHVYTKRMFDANLGKPSYSDGWAPGSAMNLQYLSVRDAMLMYAECLANDGELSAAMNLVNQIRLRAAKDINIVKNADGTPAANYKIAEYPTTHAAFTDKTTCIKAIRMERKLELAMEGQRWFDLARWGGDYMASELRAYVDYEKKHIPKFAGATYLPAAKTMFPIPDSEIQTMGNDASGKPYLVQPDAWK